MRSLLRERETALSWPSSGVSWGFPVPVLSDDDTLALEQFFERLLQLHANGVVTTESALEYLVAVTRAIDVQDRLAVRSLRFTLEEAWREEDA
jgi:hypothetical protein